MSHRCAVRIDSDEFVIGDMQTIKVPPEAISDARNKSFDQLAKYGDIQVIKRQLTKEQVIEKVQKLVQKIKDTNREVKEKKDKLNTAKWKITRRCLVQIEELGGHTAFGYDSFHAFCKANFDSGFTALFEERRTAKYEQLLGLPLCSYSRSVFIAFEAIGVFPLYRGNQYGASKEMEPIPERVELLKKAWNRAVELAKGKSIASSHIFKAVEELHEEQPDVVRVPTTRNGSIGIQKRLKELEKENAQLKEEIAKLKTHLFPGNR